MRHLPILLAFSLLVGCAGNRPQYGWLRKQGELEHAYPPAPDQSHEVIASELPAPEASVSGTEEAALVPVLIRSEDLGTSRIMAAPPALEQDTAWYAPQEHRWNTKAIISLPIAVGTVAGAVMLQSVPVLLIGGAIAFVLALIGGLQCRNRGDRGKGFAIAAMMIASATLVVGMVATLLSL